MIKKPHAPSMPNKPSEPKKPEVMIYMPKFELIKDIDIDIKYDSVEYDQYVESVLITIDSLKKIQEVVDLVLLKENIKFLSIDLYRNKVWYEELVENKRYDLEYKSYEKALNKYNIKLAEYEIKLKIYQKELETYKTLKLQYDHEQAKLNLERLQKRLETL
jgi:hypothetical protein